jgi:hypothetical protein
VLRAYLHAPFIFERLLRYILSVSSIAHTCSLITCLHPHAPHAPFIFERLLRYLLSVSSITHSCSLITCL